MAAPEAEVLDSKDLSALSVYQFLGNEVTVQRKRVCLQGIIDNHTITHGAAEAGVSRKCVHHWINTDPQFAEAVRDALDESTERLETSMYKRAMEKDTIAGIFLLKKYNPEFRDRVTIDIESVREEIQERMAQANISDLRQLPAMTNGQMFPIVEGASIPLPQIEQVDYKTTVTQRFADQCDQIQKDSDNNSSPE